jgi:hypothetical protein
MTTAAPRIRPTTRLIALTLQQLWLREQSRVGIRRCAVSAGHNGAASVRVRLNP